MNFMVAVDFTMSNQVHRHNVGLEYASTPTEPGTRIP